MRSHRPHALLRDTVDAWPPQVGCAIRAWWPAPRQARGRLQRQPRRRRHSPSRGIRPAIDPEEGPALQRISVWTG